MLQGSPELAQLERNRPSEGVRHKALMVRCLQEGRLNMDRTFVLSTFW